MREFVLSIVSVDSKQNLSEVVFSTVVEFSLLEKYPVFGQENKKTSYTWRDRRRRELGEPEDLSQVRGVCWSIVMVEAPIAC
jgi:hypothetical protein